MVSKVAIVTGGTRGIGWGISQQLARDGYSLILGFNTNEEAASTAKATLESTYGVKVHTVKGDVAEESTIETIFKCVEDNFEGKLTAFVHNSGLHVGLTTAPEASQAILAAKLPAQLLGNGNFTNFEQYDYYQNVYPKCFIRCVERAIKWGGVDSDAMTDRIKNTPMQRWALPTEIGEAVAFLCSPKAAFITGVALPVDGGLHLS